MLNCGPRSDHNHIFQQIWQTAISSEVQIFGWRLFTNALPTRGLLLQRHVITSVDDAMCVICNEDNLSVLHLFFFADSQQRCGERYAIGLVYKYLNFIVWRTIFIGLVMSVLGKKPIR